MTALPRLQRLSGTDLSDLLADLRRQGTKELILADQALSHPSLRCRSHNHWEQRRGITKYWQR